jgi:transcriptional regulator with XRE-family HTH domain
MASPSKIGARLKSLRDAATLTQRDLAARLGGKHPSWISNIETGARSPELELLERWAAACGAELRVDFVSPSPDPELEEELTKLREAPPTGEAREALLAHLRAWRALAEPRGGR